MVSRGRAWLANEVLGLMEDLELQPEEVTYNLVIKGFCQARFFEMAKRVYSALQGRCKANIKICQTMYIFCASQEILIVHITCVRTVRRKIGLLT